MRFKRMQFSLSKVCIRHFCLENMTIGELKSIAMKNIIDISDCFEKEELVERLKSAGVKRKDNLSYIEKMFGKELQTQQSFENVPTPRALYGKSLICLLFAAQHCEASTGLIPSLTRVYHSTHRRDVEIIFASRDRNEESFNEFSGSMLWPSIPWSEQARIQYLADTHNIGSKLPVSIIYDLATELTQVNRTRNEIHEGFQIFFGDPGL